MTHYDAPDWEDAACSTVDPELFFDSHYHAVHRAKKVCDICPLKKACAEYALKHPEMAEYGVWGGMSENERRSLRKPIVRTKKGKR
jgi:WhiB family transcriptional regulator, redox-sensing transcriptional regulator